MPPLCAPFHSSFAAPFTLTAHGLWTLALVAAHTAATGQTAEAGEVKPSGTTLDPVTVRVDRSFGGHRVQVGAFREQDPLDVPLTNNVVTREVLDAQGARTLFGALRNTAGVTRSQLSGSTYDNISIRGILVENRGNYRLNGSLPIINLIDIPLENKERVEVLKGSSSLYYGLVPPSGVVNFVSKRAGSEPVTSLATSVNEHGAVDVHADWGRRFGADESMGLRVNVAAGKEDIGIDNFDGHRGLVSLAYDWQVTSDLAVKLDLEHYRKDVSEQAAIALLPAGDDGRIDLPPVPENTRNLAGKWQRYDAEATNVLLRTDWALWDAWLLTLEAGRAETKRDRRYSQFQNYDIETGEGRLRINFVEGQRYTNTNYRAEVAGRIKTGTLAHEVTLGATRNLREAYSGDSATAVEVPQNLYRPRTVAEIGPAITTPGNDSEIVDRGLYLFDRINLSERWQVMVGLRYADYTIDTPTDRRRSHDTSPNAAVVFKPTPDLSIYASYLEGLEDVGTAPAGRANSGEILPPAVNKQQELGVKARVGGNALLQAALFEIDRTLTTVANNVFLVGGRSEYRGLEVSASGEIGRHWAVVASALWLDAEIVRVGADNADELGNTPENTPKRTASLFAEYRVPQVAGWAVSAGLYHVGRRQVNNLNQAELGSYTTLSLGTRYSTKWDGRQVTLQANVDNATDRDYWSSGGNGLLGYGLPRTVRLAARVDF
jgi:iron complex outermembrane receptor protein